MSSSCLQSLDERPDPVLNANFWIATSFALVHLSPVTLLGAHLYFLSLPSEFLLSLPFFIAFPFVLCTNSPSFTLGIGMVLFSPSMSLIELIGFVLRDDESLPKPFHPL